MIHSFMLTEEVEVNCNSNICIIDDQHLLISLNTIEDKGLYKLTRGGEYLNSCKHLPFYPVICGTDTKKEVLVADSSDGAMYLFKPLSQKEIPRTAILSDIHTLQTRSVVIDQNNSVWVLAGDTSDSFKLIKFAFEK